LKSLEEQLQLIKRGVVDFVTQNELEQKIKNSIQKNKPLIVKLGIDPNSSDIHLGHTVALNKLRQFQDLGHKVILIIGDYTAMIGDPSGRMTERPQLDHGTILKNVATYQEQAYKILDKDKVEIVFNGGWFEKLNFRDIIKLISKFTLAQMLEHDYFDKRFKKGLPLSIHELLYPMMQGYDSVMIKADIELGGTDQRFNVIAGRYLQKEFGQESQVGLFTPILTGLDGKNKMSKSLNNYIGVNNKPEDMYGKVMSMPDKLIIQYFELVTDVGLEEISNFEKSMKEGTNPKDIKKRLAFEIVKKFHSIDAAKTAETQFSKVFSGREDPENIEEFRVPEDKLSIVKLLTSTKLAKSNSEAQRLIKQGGVYIDKERVDDFKKEIIIKEPFILKVGKRKYLKIIQ